MNQQPEQTGPARRTVLKRTALIGGTMVWATPVVQSIAAPALAMGGSPVAGGEGPSYAILFVQCGSLNYQLKFDRNDADGTYTLSCPGSGESGLSGDARNDSVCYAGYLAARGSATYQSTCDFGVIDSYGPSGSRLRVDLAENCYLTGWFLHDGTCAGDVTSGNGKCRWSNDPATSIDKVGPDVPTPVGGAFEFAKCA